MEFYGRYIEVTPHSRLVWTNEEGDDGGAVTTTKSRQATFFAFGSTHLQAALVTEMGAP
ncbi:MAG TPA: hypothetical protein VNH14_12350 [Gemmatimonadales bacterium]|nr:hypothetical protein [Gemmatimonadales bacterium]